MIIFLHVQIEVDRWSKILKSERRLIGLCILHYHTRAVVEIRYVDTILSLHLAHNSVAPS